MALVAQDFNPWKMALMTLGAVVLTASLATRTVSAQDDNHAPKGFGLVADAGATPVEVGVPFYPGSHVKKDDDGDSGGANLGLWGMGNGMRLSVVKLESGDSPEKIAAYYRKALAKYGPVLDCPHSKGKKAEKRNEDQDAPVTCDNEQVDEGKTLLKAGTNRRQHLVSVEMEHGKALIQIVALSTWKKKDSQEN